jgi:hypothetical protein
MAQEKEPPPLPLHGVEGYGGVAITYSAYLTNPPKTGKVFGLPSFGSGFVVTPEGRWFAFITLTETIWDRLELGYGINVLSLHDLPEDIFTATGVAVGDETVYLHNFNARLMLLKEGDFDQAWLPAVTFGAHFKYNDNLSKIDNRLGGALTRAGIEDDNGFDFTLYFSKMLKMLPRPVLLDFGIRNTEAAHIGLLGFTGERDFTVEGNVVVFVTDQFLFGVEYRQKPDAYDPIPGLVEPEDDWWSVVVAYVFNEHLTMSGGVFNFGEVLNHYDDGAVGIKMKYEF